MNAPLRRLSVVTALLLASLLVSTTWIQFFAADSISAGPANSRQLYDEYGRDRGAILAAGSAVLADSTPVADEYQFQRAYANGPLYAPATGFYSILVGSSGVENGANDILSGTADQLFYRRIQDLLTNQPPQGGSVQLTIDPAVQEAAWNALGDQRGAVVAVEPATGRILAMVSKPSYDPNTLASHDLAAVQGAWDALNADPTRPLDNRGIATLYPPGSVFKLVTAAAALSEGLAQPETLLFGGAELDLPQTSTNLRNSSRRACGPNDLTSLADALRISCNTAFGQLGLDLGGDRLREQAQAFGFGAELEIPQSVAASDVPEGMNPPQSAQAAIGQFDVRVTPLQMAMVAAGIANDGVVMRPQLIDLVQAPDTTVIENFSPDEFGRAISSEAASQLTAMMELVVDDGTGTAAQISGVRVAGKTGTAQTGNDSAPHAWFTAFAPADNPAVAVAVVVENGGVLGNETSGGRVAAPVARQVIEAVLAS